MAGFRKFLSFERTSCPQASPGKSDNGSYDASTASEYSPYVTASNNSPEPNNLPRLPQMNSQTFHGFEKQFEQLHDHFSSRNATARGYKYIDTTKYLTPNTRRYVDVSEAIFSSSRYRITTPLSPSSIYNEDIADRNIHPDRPHKPKLGRYSNVISAIYQEDVADRNILIGGGIVPSPYSDPTGISPQYHDKYARPATSLSNGRSDMLRSKQSMPECRDTQARGRTNLRAALSEQNLRNLPRPMKSYAMRSFQQSRDDQDYSSASSTLRPRTSAPSLSSDRTSSFKQKLSPIVQLEAADAPSSPQSSDRGDDSDNPAVERPASKQRNRPTEAAPPSRPETPQNTLLRPNAVRSTSRKNVRDLSINVEIAAPKKQFVKVPPKPADLPAPTPRRDQPSASIAEIVNSPLSLTTPAGASEKMPTYNADEIMSMFKQAYLSTQAASPHPTFENLQDAIVREINSHDAFHKLNSGAASPESSGLSADPIDSDCTSDVSQALSFKPSARSTPTKDRQQVIVKKSPTNKQRRNSDMPTGRELSFPALKGLELRTAHTAAAKQRRRRHTYTQPISLDLVHEYQSLDSTQEDTESRGWPSLTPGSTAQTSRTSQPNSRPHSSHSLLSKTMSSILDKQDVAKWGISRKSARHSVGNNRPSSRISIQAQIHDEDEDEDDPDDFEPPVIQLDSVREQKASASASASPSDEDYSQPDLPFEPRTISGPVKKPRKTNSARRLRYSTSPLPVGRNRIPLRRSSIQKDLFDSGRFRA